MWHKLLDALGELAWKLGFAWHIIAVHESSKQPDSGFDYSPHYIWGFSFWLGDHAWQERNLDYRDEYLCANRFKTKREAIAFAEAQNL